ncbi:alpha/beta fold hydrolase [Spirosoma endophyticum]|uniref:Pimeloyl-ACP methyl ester carboxylesterase n=1 Tax=Spirosoma endophyticum TaxID=662367 RepID=A0A1I1RFK1_9BACT|nr:alpha/beta hydrolase [Spirosoma endophyticum]SFD33176.1 Pimeloyl-ACP methyl ester carboxylesterase [Spirosoma endophyticum]
MKLFLFVISLLLSFLSRAQTSREPLFTSFDGTKIHYDVLGEGKPVVLLHGFISNSESWKRAPVRQALADAGFKVVMLDLRGNGQSDKPHTAEAYRDNAELKDVIALMKHLGLTNYDVVGYSRGAILTAKLLTMDKQVHRAVMGGISVDFSDPNWFRRKNFHEALTKPGSHPELQPAIDYAKKSGADTVVLARLQEFQPVTSRAELGKVKVPVLVVNGNQDKDNGDPQTLVDAVPGSKLVIVPGDHGGAMRTPEFAKAVVEFLTK